MPEPHVLYLEGDPCSPKFVEGAFHHAGVTWDRPETPTADGLRRADVLLLSDWPAGKLPEGPQRLLAQAVADGTGLVMAGGWKSLGRGGYAGTPVGDLLPVRLHDGDDRRAFVQGAYPRAREPEHPLLEGLDLRAPPVLCGQNRVTARDGATVVLETVALRFDGDGPPRMEPAGDLLVAGRHGGGRVAVLATDPAPHWSGGLTDWGDPLPAPQDEEVGHHYVRFVGNLLRWAAGD